MAPGQNTVRDRRARLKLIPAGTSIPKPGGQVRIRLSAGASRIRNLGRVEDGAGVRGLYTRLADGCFPPPLTCCPSPEEHCGPDWYPKGRRRSSRVRRSPVAGEPQARRRSLRPQPGRDASPGSADRGQFAERSLREASHCAHRLGPRPGGHHLMAAERFLYALTGRSVEKRGRGGCATLTCCWDCRKPRGSIDERGAWPSD